MSASLTKQGSGIEIQIENNKSVDSEQKPKAASSGEPEKPKPCCACPETRLPRDECIVEKGEASCQDLIQAHRECMAKYGFII